MLHILLLILKITGIILLSISGLILFLLAVILLDPLKYRGFVRKIKGIEAQGKITWLFRIISVEMNFDGKALSSEIRLFGRSLTDRKKKKEKKGKKEEQPKKQGTVSMPETEYIPSSEAVSDEAELTEPVMEEKNRLSQPPVLKEKKSTQNDSNKKESVQKKEDSEKEKHFYEKESTHEKTEKKEQFGNKWNGIKKKGESLKSTADRYLAFWNHTVTQKAKQHVWKEVCYLIRHITPDRLGGTIEIGFDDPAITGQVLGILWVVSVFCGNSLEVKGDFERKILQGEIKISGHIRLIHIVRAGLVLLLDRNIRETWKRFRALT